ncbi:hypothetical protein BJ875DRAFT_512018 [Amylocarpus encephaloides]|uniref:Uncharacterized protein n=1 Tax=Amylocarpus encephaloides TaxID=45428 RepID=A0A9P8C4D2_9HELO|nr:hypothetical protein BJ875DRAFT_512018 [Amylocarpus encephaloides]
MPGKTTDIGPLKSYLSRDGGGDSTVTLAPELSLSAGLGPSLQNVIVISGGIVGVAEPCKSVLCGGRLVAKLSTCVGPRRPPTTEGTASIYQPVEHGGTVLYYEKDQDVVSDKNPRDALATVIILGFTTPYETTYWSSGSSIPYVVFHTASRVSSTDFGFVLVAWSPPNLPNRRQACRSNRLFLRRGPWAPKRDAPERPGFLLARS